MGSRISTVKKRLVVLVDLGCTLRDFEGYFLTKFREKYPNEPYIPCDERNKFNILEDYERLPGTSRNIKNILKNILNSKGFGRDIPEINGAVRALQEMAKMKGVDVFIVAVPSYPSEYKYNVAETYEWVENHLGTDWLDKIVITCDKTLIEGHILIDDNVDISGAIEDPSWNHVVFSACYNKKSNLYGKTRLDNWTNGKWKTIIENAKHSYMIE